MRGQPKLLSIGFAVPPRSYTQREVFDACRYPRAFWPIFRDSQIDKRHLAVPLGSTLSWQEATALYRSAAIELSVQAAKQCLEGWPIDQVGSLSLASCTGYECPAVSYHVHQHLALSAAAEHTDSIGTGCQGAGPALRSAYLYSRETGGMALTIATEICSACDFPEPGGVPRPDNRYELLRAKAIFGDGAAAALVGYDDDPLHPYFVDFESHFDARYVDYLGFRWVDGRLLVVLHHDVPKVAPAVVGPCVARLLGRHGLALRDIRWVSCHPGGRAVLDHLRDALGFTEEQLFYSRQVLREYGNMSSGTIGAIGKVLAHERERVRPGDWILMVTMGAGFATVAALLRFPTGGGADG